MIGEKYLWIDSLYLVQDDIPNDMQLMDFVYENAPATIVAANGSAADVGLRIFHSASFQRHQMSNNQARPSNDGTWGFGSSREQIEMGT